MKRCYLPAALLLALSSQVQALNVGDITTFMLADATQVNKEIKNSTDSARLVNVGIERLSSPLASGKVIPMESQGELLMSPVRMILPADSSESVNFFYKGPSDDRERYYRIVWLDQALTDAGQTTSAKNATATTSARIGTILVVSPRQERFDFQFNQGKLKNSGNTSFKGVAYGTCLDVKKGKDCRENYFVLPGQERAFKQVNVSDKKGYVAIWHGEKFISVK